MQWTVRYLLYNAGIWRSALTDLNITPGAQAYANRQQAMWHALALRADKAFSKETGDYISPLS
jgi:hypothetical protein